MDDLDCVVSPDCLTNIVLGLCYVEATTHELLSPEKGWPVVETCDLISTLVVKDDSVKFFVVVFKFELPNARFLNFPKNSASVFIRLVLIIGDCV